MIEVKSLKKVLINLIIIFSFIIIYLLQANLFTSFKIAGVMPNLFIILILYIGLFAGKIMGITYGIFIGIIIDLIIGRRIGITAIGLGIIGLISAIFDSNFSKDSRITIMIMVFLCTILFECIEYFLNFLILEINLEIISFIKILIVEAIYNIIITIIIYPLVRKTGYNIEDKFKESRMLTRYF